MIRKKKFPLFYGPRTSKVWETQKIVSYLWKEKNEFKSKINLFIDQEESSISENTE